MQVETQKKTDLHQKGSIFLGENPKVFAGQVNKTPDQNLPVKTFFCSLLSKKFIKFLVIFSF